MFVTIFSRGNISKKVNVKFFPSLKAHGAALISVAAL